MVQRSDLSPSSLPVEVSEESVAVEYLDGRRATYRTPPEPVGDAVRCQPGKEVHVVVVRPESARGVVIYVNDRKTDDEILESSGVGRVVLARGETTELVPGVTVRADGYAIEVEADPSAVEGRVFVFEEDELGERAFELIDP